MTPLQVVVTVRGTDGEITSADDDFHAMLGYAPGALSNIERAWEALTPSELRALDRTAQAEVAESGFATPYHKELLHRDGSRLPVQVMTTRGDGAGAWVAYVVNLLLARERATRATEDAALRASESLFRILATASPLGVFLTNAAGDCTYANPRLGQIWNLDPGEMLGRGFVRHTHPEDLAPMRALWRDALALERRFDAHYRLLLPDGKVRHLRMWIAPMHESGAFSGFVGSVEDETERVALERRLRQSEKMQSLGTLAGGIAHDFNNILGAVIGNVELALPASDEQPALRDRLLEIHAAGMRARELVRQILTFSRRSEPPAAPVDLVAVLAQTQRLLRATMPAAVQLEVRMPEQPLMLLGDTTALQQILVNLCGNAEYAMRQRGSGRIVIEADKDEAGARVLLVVRDDGPGMSAEVRERAFEPFFTTKPLGEGSGMGLAVVDGLVAGMRGSIALESTPGAGTEVRVTLPLFSGSAAAAQDPPAGPAAPAALYDVTAGHGQSHILLVEDEPAVLAVMTRMLELAGFRVTACSGGDAGLASFLTAPESIDLVLSDVSMPDLRGDQLAQQIREARPDVPIILMTGFSHNVTSEGARALGIVALLQKPLTARELVQVIREALGASGGG